MSELLAGDCGSVIPERLCLRKEKEEGSLDPTALTGFSSNGDPTWRQRSLPSFEEKAENRLPGDIIPTPPCSAKPWVHELHVCF